MFIVYAQAAEGARSRPSDVILEGVRLQFIGTRYTSQSAHDLAARESKRVNGLAAIYSVAAKTRPTQAAIKRFVASYERGEQLDIALAPTWRCLYCGDEIVEGAGCQKPECIKKHEAAQRRMGMTVRHG